MSGLFDNEAEADQFLEIYTDGGCSGNPGAGAWAFVCPAAGVNQSGAEAQTTNNKMELYAAIAALRWVSSGASSSAGEKKIVLYTDSQYVKKGMTEWIHQWQKRGWKRPTGEPVQNRDLWEALLAAAEACKKNGAAVVWQWVKGHAGHEHNETCHNLVVQAIKQIGRAA